MLTLNTLPKVKPKFRFAVFRTIQTGTEIPSKLVYCVTEPFN